MNARSAPEKSNDSIACTENSNKTKLVADNNDTSISPLLDISIEDIRRLYVDNKETPKHNTVKGAGYNDKYDKESHDENSDANADADAADENFIADAA